MTRHALAVAALLAGCQPVMEGDCPNPDHPQVNYFETCPEFGYECTIEGWTVDIHTHWEETCGCGCVQEGFVEKWRRIRREQVNEDWNP